MPGVSLATLLQIPPWVFTHWGFRRKVAKRGEGSTRTRSAQVGYLQKTTLQLTQHRQQPPLTLLQAMQLKISLVVHLNSW